MLLVALIQIKYYFGLHEFLTQLFILAYENNFMLNFNCRRFRAHRRQKLMLFTEPGCLPIIGIPTGPWIAFIANKLNDLPIFRKVFERHF